MDILMGTVLTGIGATAIVDLWAVVRKRLLGVPQPNYGLVGRWIAHMPRGRFFHASIADTRRMQGERAIGWIAHYLIGIAFAGLLVVVAGPEWLRHPRIGPALAIGIGTLLAPFLLMQPGMGAGIAARRTARPSRARLHSLVTHAMFGVGLYVAGSAARVFN